MKKLAFLFLLFGCASANHYTAIEPIGIVLDTTPTSVLVCFPISGSKKGLSQGCATYTLRGGHYYQKGDAYPDPNKYPFHFQSNNK